MEDFLPTCGFNTQLDCAFAAMQLFRLYEAYNHSTIEPLVLIEWSRVRLLMTWIFLFVFLYIGIPYPS